ncbi:hypothetical protein V5799_031214 [Amblyomma americanum]|uniref:Peptidase S1 domain-containing protein n=1 Tax=Amblyomma americanum TaxID=6943 RepID=A0AAQ4EL12_AMBAM
MTQGDSGGPLFQIINDTAVQIGIVSWGRSCAVPNSPGVYTNVQPFLSWIEDVLRYNSSSKPRLRPRARPAATATRPQPWRRLPGGPRRTPAMAMRGRRPLSRRPPSTSRSGTAVNNTGRVTRDTM